MTLGTITLKNLKTFCIIGILPKERKQEQELRFDLMLKINFNLAEKTENIHQTVDYSILANFFINWVKQEKFFLIETLSKRGCEIILTKFKLIESCTIVVKKPAAVPAAEYTAVSYHINRTNLEE